MCYGDIIKLLVAKIKGWWTKKTSCQKVGAFYRFCQGTKEGRELAGRLFLLYATMVLPTMFLLQAFTITLFDNDMEQGKMAYAYSGSHCYNEVTIPS